MPVCAAATPTSFSCQLTLTAVHTRYRRGRYVSQRNNSRPFERCLRPRAFCNRYHAIDVASGRLLLAHLLWDHSASVINATATQSARI